MFYNVAFTLSATFYAETIGCGDPGPVSNAVRTGSSFSYGDFVIYTCNHGYSGGGAMVCQTNGQWTQRPTCTGVYFKRYHLLTHR